MPATAPAPRLDTVDVLRGLSILFVVLHHTFLHFMFAGYSMRPLMPRPLAHLLFLNGNNSVTVFFAISGFLITLTSLRRFGSLADMRPGRFYRIRFARIAPLLLLLLAILSTLALTHANGFTFSPKQPPLWRAVLSALTFHLNWLEARFGYLPANWDILWSLSVEEMFYLFFPLVCLATLRPNRHTSRQGLPTLIAILLAFVAMGPFARSIWTHNEIWRDNSYLGGMDAIALGCLTALLTHHLSSRLNQRHSTAPAPDSSGRSNLTSPHPRPATAHSWPSKHPHLLLATQLLGAALIALVYYGPRWFYSLPPHTLDTNGSYIALGACLVILPSVLRQTSTPTRSPARWTAPLRWYGRHSYEVYLTHEFLVVLGVNLFLRFHPNPNPNGPAPNQLTLPGLALWFAAILLLTAPLGWLISRFFSEPLNRRLRGLPPRPKKHLLQTSDQPTYRY